MMAPPPVLLATAGWSIPLAEAERFPGEGSHLERYARVLAAAEINSSFHRRHRASTYARWKEAVPEHFRFSAKIPKEITHKLRLNGTEKLVEEFLQEVSPLGGNLQCLLIQLPPSFQFEAKLVRAFLSHLRRCTSVPLACEPRHASWFESAADALLAKQHVARVAADPAIVPAAAEPGGCRDFAYFRLHGAPKMYYSRYPAAFIESLSDRLQEEAERGGHVWCVFDNTTLGAAATNALECRERLPDQLCLPK